MAGPSPRIIFTQSAWSDLEEIVAYWSQRGEPRRGEEMARVLPAEAIRDLSDAGITRAGPHLLHTAYPETQELPVFERACRILYLLLETEAILVVLRFWHSHRDGAFHDD